MQTLKVLKPKRINLPEDWCRENNIKPGSVLLSRSAEPYGAPKGSLLLIPEVVADR